MQNRRRLTALALTAICLATTSARAANSRCPNLSGKYVIQGEDGQVHISIEQHKCDRIIIVRESGYLGTITSEKHILKLDGREQADTPWLGAARPYRTSARFMGSDLLVEAMPEGDSPLTIIYSLTAGRDLQEDANPGLGNLRRGSGFVAKRER
jgi:hypothetical protein